MTRTIFDRNFNGETADEEKKGGTSDVAPSSQKGEARAAALARRQHIVFMFSFGLLKLKTGMLCEVSVFSFQVRRLASILNNQNLVPHFLAQHFCSKDKRVAYTMATMLFQNIGNNSGQKCLAGICTCLVTLKTGMLAECSFHENSRETTTMRSINNK